MSICEFVRTRGLPETLEPHSAYRLYLKKIEAGNQMATNTAEFETLSSILRSALDADKDGEVALGEVLDRVAERGFGLLLILFSLPMLIPMPPGTSGPIGILLALIGGQMIGGRHTPWLPQRARNFRLSAKLLNLLQNHGVNFLQKVEKLSRPRLAALENPFMLRITGFMVVFLGLVLSLPLPFMNSLPAIPVLLFGIGLMNRDGVFLLLGNVLTLALIVGMIVFAQVFKTAFLALFYRIKAWF